MVVEWIEYVIIVVIKLICFEDLFENDWIKDSLVMIFLVVLDLIKY